MGLSGLSGDIAQAFEAIPLDRTTIAQEQINLANKSRSSLFPWRGQFSPELVALFLDTYSTRESVVLDPFVGSGTTLFEAARKQRPCYGGEMNPAAFAMSSTILFANITSTEREMVLQEARKYIAQPYHPQQLDLFGQPSPTNSMMYGKDHTADYLPFDALLSVYPNQSYQQTTAQRISSILINTLIRATALSPQYTPAQLAQAFEEYSYIVRMLPYTPTLCQVMLSDARTLPIPKQSVDLVIASPPYINVFNYHQNYRQAMDALGWDMLQVAKSEIGANRKHRHNRFLTVIQYALDMQAVFEQLSTIVSPTGRIILVVGRESRIRGIAFNNAHLVAALGIQTGMVLSKRQARWFVNKFGATIYEDILHFHPPATLPMQHQSQPIQSEMARTLAADLLLEAARYAEQPCRGEIIAAVEQQVAVQPSPFFTAPSSLPFRADILFSIPHTNRGVLPHVCQTSS